MKTEKNVVTFKFYYGDDESFESSVVADRIEWVDGGSALQVEFYTDSPEAGQELAEDILRDCNEYDNFDFTWSKGMLSDVGLREKSFKMSDVSLSDSDRMKSGQYFAIKIC